MNEFYSSLPLLLKDHGQYTTRGKKMVIIIIGVKCLLVYLRPPPIYYITPV